MYWIFSLSLWGLAGVSFIGNRLLSIWRIEIGGVELLEVDNNNNKGDI